MIFTPVPFASASAIKRVFWELDTDALPLDTFRMFVAAVKKHSVMKDTLKKVYIPQYKEPNRDRNGRFVKTILLIGTNYEIHIFWNQLGWESNIEWNADRTD